MDRNFDLAEDSEGNILVCGIQDSQQLWMVWRVEKLNPEGQPLWSDSWSLHEEVGTSCAWQIAVGPDDSAVAVGWHDYTGVIAIRKYSPSGNILWSLTIGGDEDSHDRATSVAINESGEIFVGAHLRWSRDVVIYKISSFGELAWSAELGLPGFAWDLALANNGDILVAIENIIRGKPAVIRCDASGNVRWTWEHTAVDYGLISSLAMDPVRQCFYAFGHYQMGGSAPIRLLARFSDDEGGGQSASEWLASYENLNGWSIDVDSSGDIWTSGSTDSLWSITRLDATTDPGHPALLACTINDFNWIEEPGNRREFDVEGESSSGHGIACTADGGIASCGYIVSQEEYLWASETVKLMPAQLRHGNGPGPNGNGNPDTPGHGGTGGLKPGDVKVVGGINGYVDPRRGQGATVSLYPTSAGEVVLKVVDRRGSVLKEISAPASGSGPMDLVWDGTDSSGDAVAPGIYAVLIKGPGIKKVQKVAVVY